MVKDGGVDLLGAAVLVSLVAGDVVPIAPGSGVQSVAEDVHHPVARQQQSLPQTVPSLTSSTTTTPGTEHARPQNPTSASQATRSALPRHGPEQLRRLLSSSRYRLVLVPFLVPATRSQASRGLGTAKKAHRRILGAALARRHPSTRFAPVTNAV